MLKIEKSGIVIGNTMITRHIKLDKKLAVTEKLVNKLTGKEVRIGSEEFSIRIDGISRPVCGSNCKFLNHEAKKLENSDSLTLCYLHPESGTKVDVTYTVEKDNFYLRKQLRIDAGECLVREVCVEDLQVKNEKFKFGGFGQPLFMGSNFFLGLEYPAGHNFANSGHVRLAHYPGRTGTIESKTAVLGVCPDTENNRLRDWFMRYIEANRATPAIKHHCQYCRAPNRTKISGWKLGLMKKTFADRGLHIDSLYVHSGETVFKYQGVSELQPASKQKPDLHKLAKAGKAALGAGIGFHLNTGGGRNSSDHAWFRERFDMISPMYYCIADPRVKELLIKNLSRLVREYQSEFFSFDWLWWKTAWECPQGGHRGHIKGLKYSREAITDAFMELVKALRKEKPDIILEDLEVELSPWWLFHVDALWSYAGEGSRIPHTLLDGSLRNWLLKTNVYPMNSIWYAVNPPHGWGPWPKNQFLDKHEEWQGLVKRTGETPPREFANNLLMQYLRGSRIDEIFFLIENLTPLERRLYGDIMAWARAHAGILLNNTAWILGDPGKGHAYGLAHFLPDNRGIVGIYNPCPWKKRTVTLKFDESSNFSPGVKPVAAAIIYPYCKKLTAAAEYGDQFKLEVQGKELLVIATGKEAENAPEKETGFPSFRKPKLEALKISPPDSDNKELKVKFSVKIPHGEKVTLRVMQETPFSYKLIKDSESSREIFEQRKQEVFDEFNRKGKRMTFQRKMEAEILGMEKILKAQALPFFEYDIKTENGRLPVVHARNIQNRLVKTMTHPKRISTMYAFAETFSEKPIASGIYDISLKAKWRESRFYIWLERERRIGEIISGASGEAFGLPGDWQQICRETYTIYNGDMEKA